MVKYPDRRSCFECKKKNSKIVKYRRFPLFNIGTVMFGILFVYMIVCLIMYLTSTHITAYEVTAGPLSGNYRYTALAVKSEKVVTASQSGSVSYYAREGTKVGKGNNVCSVDESGKLAEAVASASSGMPVIWIVPPSPRSGEACPPLPQILTRNPTRQSMSLRRTWRVAS